MPLVWPSEPECVRVLPVLRPGLGWPGIEESREEAVFSKLLDLRTEERLLIQNAALTMSAAKALTP